MTDTLEQQVKEAITKLENTAVIDNPIDNSVPVDSIKQEDKQPEVQEISSLMDYQVSIEEQARSQGWRPKEEFHGDPKDWKDAKHFLEVGENWRRQANLKRELEELRNHYKSLAEDNAQIKKLAYEQAYNDILQAKARISTSLNPNLSEYEQLLQKEQQLKQAMNQPAQQPQEDPRISNIKNSAAWAKFTLLNPWFNKEDADSLYLRHRAHEIGSAMGVPETESEINAHLTQLHNKIHKEYGHIINKLNPQRPIKTMPVTYAGKAGGHDYSNADYLTEANRQALAYLESKGDKDAIDAYMKSLKKN